MRLRGQAGVTLIEVLIAVTLLSLLSVGMLMAMRVGMNAWGKANNRLMDNRRAAGAHRVLESQIAGLMPVTMLCQTAPGAPAFKGIFFQGEPQSMRFVSAYSLQEAWRGLPRILEFQVIPREGGGYRLIVNELPYTGPESAGAACLGLFPDAGGLARPRFREIEPGSHSFVLADRLAYCRFSYLEPGRPPIGDQWRVDWITPRWPRAVRIEMAGLDARETADLRPVTFAAPIRINRNPGMQYVDQ
jgi:general secretion pathway protein J